MTSIPSLTGGGGEEAAIGREIQKISQPRARAGARHCSLYLTDCDHKRPDNHLESPEEGEESAVVPGRHVGVDHRGQAQA